MTLPPKLVRMDKGSREPRSFSEPRIILFSSVRARYFQLIFPHLVLVILKQNNNKYITYIFKIQKNSAFTQT